MYNLFTLDFPEFSDFLRTIVSITNLLIVIYVFNYTRNKDKNEIQRNQKIKDQKITLQWFKELILQPNLPSINQFYDNITIILNKLPHSGIQHKDLIKISSDVKAEQAKIRKSFVDLLRIADVELERSIKTNLDNLIGTLDTTIFDKGINFSHLPAFEKEIISKVIYSKNDLMSTIYGYKGLKT